MGNKPRDALDINGEYTGQKGHYLPWNRHHFVMLSMFICLSDDWAPLATIFIGKNVVLKE